jgi:hypothetical protein
MNPASFVLVLAVMTLLIFMVKQLGKLLKSEKSKTQRIFLILTIWLLAGFGLVITIATNILVYRTIAG